jgi:non-canonical (house-cleaning) NTP pyrophosphatase
MKIIVASENPVKLNAVKKDLVLFFRKFRWKG